MERRGGRQGAQAGGRFRNAGVPPRCTSVCLCPRFREENEGQVFSEEEGGRELEKEASEGMLPGNKRELGFKHQASFQRRAQAPGALRAYLHRLPLLRGYYEEIAPLSTRINLSAGLWTVAAAFHVFMANYLFHTQPQKAFCSP